MKKKIKDDFKEVAQRLNIVHLTKEEQEEILEGLGEVAFQRIIIRIFKI